MAKPTQPSSDGDSEDAVGIEPQRFRDMMSRVCSPVTIVTTADDAGPHGATASSFSSLSQDPPLITVAFDRRSALLNRILVTRRFGINLLGHAQEDLAMLFSARDVDRFDGTVWHYASGLPRIDDVAGWIECSLYDAVPGGDHLLLLGLVTDAGKVEMPPLVYAYRTFGTHSNYAERSRRAIVDHISACSY
jgi:flavin reductase (DIM6/NTAB) family NADH-FMN oxidoreductase RutF